MSPHTEGLLRFCCREFQIHLLFHRTGGLSGELFEFNRNSSILRKDLVGLFHTDENLITELSFWTSEDETRMTVFTASVSGDPERAEKLLLKSVTIKDDTSPNNIQVSSVTMLRSPLDAPHFTHLSFESHKSS